jgi:hypothetical protein
LLDLFLAEIKGNMPGAGYMGNLAPKLSRFNAKDYFDKLKELATAAIRYHGQDRTDLHC